MRLHTFFAPPTWCLGLLLIMAVPPLAAYDFSSGTLGLKGKIQSQISVGAAVRTQQRSGLLVGKLNLPGQQQFCEDKPAGRAPGQNCTVVAGNAAYLALPGAANVNNDNGDLNYDKGEVFAANIRFAPRLQLTHDKFGIDISAVGFYDPINYHFKEYHPNNLPDNNGFQPRFTPRQGLAARQVGLDAQLLDAYLTTTLPLPGERELSLKLGNQILSLGTTTLLVFNGLNSINPPDANLRFLPGSDVRDVFQRVPLAVLGTSLTESLSVQGFYQFMWKPVVTPPIGSYFSTSDLIGAGDHYVQLLFGKTREDPNNLVGRQERTQGNANLLSNAGRTLFFNPDQKPHNGGEYGFDFTFLAKQFNNTSFEFAYLNLHSRFPTVGFVASDEGCSNRAQNQADALVQCQGFKPVPGNIQPPPGFDPSLVGKELLPLDTVRPFLDYPSNIHIFGASFSTNLGPVAWTGEVVYRANQPLQVDPVDVGYAALQPTFPTPTLQFGAVDVPSERVATPDYIETIYRHETVLPNQLIRGYERFKTIAYNTSFLFLTGASDNPFGADQVSTLIEIGGYQIIGLPSLDQLQIATPGTEFHHSAGVDGSGTPNAQQNATGAQNRLNPHYQEGGFATSFSYGYRILNQLAYENVLPDMRVAPQIVWFHDVGGRAPQPVGEFVAGRKQAIVGINVVYKNALATNLRYNWFFGGGRANNLSDRDNLSLSVSYDF